MTDLTWTPGLIVVAVVVALHVGVLGIVALNRIALGRSLRRIDAVGADRVSVLVPARNEEANLARLLPTLLAQRGVEFEIVVVDDASEDGTWRVLQEHVAQCPEGNPTLIPLKGSGPPTGWVGKVHALYQATRVATGDVFVFLDADAELRDADALARLVGRWRATGGAGHVLTGLPRYLDRVPASLLTSLVPFAVVAALPIPLVPRTPRPSVSALNGQIWVMGAADYDRLEPHAANAAEVLEDVKIGRFVKRQGLTLHFVDLQPDLAVRMYESFGDAWAGFRKNAYLIGGGRPAPFAFFFAVYTLCWVVPSVAWLWAGTWGLVPLATLYLAKGLIDRWGRFPLAVTALSPLVLLLGAGLQLDSAWAHARGSVAWKGREVGRSGTTAATVGAHPPAVP